jgi:hypothetical protein
MALVSSSAIAPRRASGTPLPVSAVSLNRFANLVPPVDVGEVDVARLRSLGERACPGEGRGRGRPGGRRWRASRAGSPWAEAGGLFRAARRPRLRRRDLPRLTRLFPLRPELAQIGRGLLLVPPQRVDLGLRQPIGRGEDRLLLHSSTLRSHGRTARAAMARARGMYDVVAGHSARCGAAGFTGGTFPASLACFRFARTSRKYAPDSCLSRAAIRSRISSVDWRRRR